MRKTFTFTSWDLKRLYSFSKCVNLETSHLSQFQELLSRSKHMIMSVPLKPAMRKPLDDLLLYLWHVWSCRETVGVVSCLPSSWGGGAAIILGVQCRRWELQLEGQFMSPSPGLSLHIHKLPIFGHFSTKPCCASHSFLLPNNGQRASGLSLGWSCSPDQQRRRKENVEITTENNPVDSIMSCISGLKSQKVCSML